MSVSLPPVESYADALTALMPRGKGWPEARGPNWRALMLALAPELRRMDVEAATVIEEADPRTAVETIPDYERVLDLPDACLGEPEGIDERRALVIALLLMKGGASPPYFEALGASFDRPCEVSEEFAFVCGTSGAGDGLAAEVDTLQAGADCGSFLSDLAAPFQWWITSEASWASRVYADEDGAEAGALLLDFGDARLECLVERFKPDHTRVHHEYDATAAVAALEVAA